MPNTEHALVAFARGAGAWILYAAGPVLNTAIDNFGRDADEVGLLHESPSLPARPQGLLVWEGMPDTSERHVPRFREGQWRELTVAEWVQVRGGDLALWPNPGFVEPRS